MPVVSKNRYAGDLCLTIFSGLFLTIPIRITDALFAPLATSNYLVDIFRISYHGGVYI